MAYRIPTTIAAAILAVVLGAVGMAPAQEETTAGVLIHGKYVITGETIDGKLEIVKNGAVYQEKGTIKEIGDFDALKAKYPKASMIGGNDKVVTPGFVNGHHHTSGVSFFQTGMTDEVLETWLGKMGKTQADRYYNELYSYMKNIRTGVTEVLQTDNCGDLEKWLNAAKDSGIRVMVGMAVGGKGNDKYFETFDKMWKTYVTPESRIKIFFAPWGIHWASDDLLKKVLQEAKKYSTGVHVHLAETKAQADGFIKSKQESLTQHAAKIGFLDPIVSCGHAVWLDDSDIDALQKSGSSVVTNPSSNLRLQSGIAPIEKFVKKGINVAIGMDGLAFNDDEDIFAELKLCWYLHKGFGKNAEGITAEDVFRMGTINGAKALGLQDIAGSLKSGKKADVVLINLANIEGISAHPDLPIVDLLLIRGRSSDIDTVMVDGEILYQNGKFTKLNEAEIVQKLKESVKIKGAK